MRMPVNCEPTTTNHLNVNDVCNWLRRNVDLENENLQEVLVRYLKQHPNIVEKYVTQSVTIEQLDNWKKSKSKDLALQNRLEFPSPVDLTEDILPIIEAGESYLLFSRLSIVLQQAVKADRIQVEFVDQVTRKSQDITYHIADMKETDQYHKLTVTINFVNNAPKAILTILRHCDSFPFTDIERGTVAFISNAIAICFWLYQSSTNKEKSEKGDSFLRSILPHSSSLGIEPDVITTVIQKILSHAQRILAAERSTLFLLNESTNELVAEYFSLGDDVFTYNENVRCAIGEGFAGHAAATRRTLNIRDCYSDPRFKNVENITGYVTKNLISCPVIYCDKVIGVLEALNKIGSSAFTSADEKAGQSLTTYCSLALHLAKLQGKIKTEEKRLDVAMEMLKYHSQVKKEDVAKLCEKPYLTTSPPFIDEIHFDYTRFKKAEVPRLFIHVFHLLFGENSFPMEQTCSFIQTVLINYRDVPYHNIFHAYNVAHSMYLMLRNMKDAFSITEMKTLIVACVCHDLDHRGFTNDYLVKIGSPLASLYQESILENHHYQLTISILQEEQNNIFCDLSVQEHAKMLDDLEPLVLATDISLFHGNMARVQELFDKNQFDIRREETKKKFKCLMMIGCDLSAVCKPWPIYLKVVKNMYREFYAQGDEQKKMGEKLLTMMDRERQESIPDDQIRFLEAICIPCYKIIAQAFPQTNNFLLGCQKIIEIWKDKQTNGTLPNLDIQEDKRRLHTANA